MSDAILNRRVSLLVLPESYPAVLYSLYELFSAVGHAWYNITGEPDTAHCHFSPMLVSRDGAPVRLPVGPTMNPDAAIADAPMPDIVIVNDLSLTQDFDPRGRWSEEADWVRACQRDGSVVCSVCSGTVFLAETGLLDGLEATSHWAAMPILRHYYPKVKLRPERVLCPSGTEHRVITAGGPSTWTDLGLYLIARFAGETEARRMAKLFVIGDTSEGQLPFAAMARPRQTDDAAITEVQVWIANHYDCDQPVARMAQIAGMAERTFSRRFRKATGYGPVEYVQSLRIEEAKQLLETTQETMDEVAEMVGYRDLAYFRRIFKRSVGVTPARYRQQFSRIRYADRAD